MKRSAFFVLCLGMAVNSSGAVAVAIESGRPAGNISRVLEAFNAKGATRSSLIGNSENRGRLKRLRFMFDLPDDPISVSSGLWPTAQGNRGHHFALPFSLDEANLYVSSFEPNGHFLILYREDWRQPDSLYILIGQPIESFLFEMVNLDLVKTYKAILDHIAESRRHGRDLFQDLPIHYPGLREAVMSWERAGTKIGGYGESDPNFLYNLRVQLVARNYVGQMDELIQSAVFRSHLHDRMDYHVQSYGIGRTASGGAYLLYTLKPTVWGSDWVSRWSRLLTELESGLSVAHQIKIFNSLAEPCINLLVPTQRGLN